MFTTSLHRFPVCLTRASSACAGWTALPTVLDDDLNSDLWDRQYLCDQMLQVPRWGVELIIDLTSLTELWKTDTLLNKCFTITDNSKGCIPPICMSNARHCVHQAHSTSQIPSCHWAHYHSTMWHMTLLSVWACMWILTEWREWYYQPHTAAVCLTFLLSRTAHGPRRAEQELTADRRKSSRHYYWEGRCLAALLPCCLGARQHPLGGSSVSVWRDPSRSLARDVGYGY